MQISPTFYTSKQVFQANNPPKGMIINGKKLIPKSEYKGPILKLTKSDNEKIVELQEKIENLEFEHLKLSSIILNKNTHDNARDYYNAICIGIEAQIATFRAEMERIKTKRHQKQIAKMNQGTGS